MDGEEVYSLLNHTIPKQPNVPQYIDDTVFDTVKDLLEQHPDDFVKKWSENPRLYTLLRLLGYDDDSNVFATFDHEQIGDVWLPLPPRLLAGPLSSSGLSVADYRKTYPHVLSSPEVMANTQLLAGIHSHKHIIRGGAHFEELETLGQGGSAQVLRVKHKLSKQEFACKRITRGETIRQQRDQLIEFEQEVAILQRIRHDHVISYVASYTDFESFSLILRPVANDVLKNLLARQDEENPLSPDDVAVLRSAFGCLATGLAYIHKEKIRHKDIKPGNILISGGRVYFCDFGISRDWSSNDNSTTSGDVRRHTPRYCSPEVIKKGSRNTRSDMWSLGCVFLEMITAIRGCSLDKMDEFLLDNSGYESSQGFWCAPEAIDKWLEKIKNDTQPSADDYPLEWIKSLIREDPDERLTADDLTKLIHKESHDLGNTHLFMGPCCRRVDSVISPEPAGLGIGYSPRTTSSSFQESRDSSSPRLETPSRQRDGSVSPRSIQPALEATRTHSRTTSNPFPTLSSDQRSSRSRFSSSTSQSSPPVRQSMSSFRPPSIPPIADHEVHCLCAAEKDETHIFNAPVSWFSCEADLPTIETEERCQLRERRVQVYETPPGDLKMELGSRSSEDVAKPKLWWVTRRMVVSHDIGDPPARHCSSFWLPLADLCFSVRNNEVVLRWSDCNQTIEKSSGNYGQYYDWSYSPTSPNNYIIVRFNDSSDAQAFVDCVRFPTRDGVTVHSSQMIDISDSQEVHIFDIGRKVPGGIIRDYRAIVLTNTARSGLQTSKLFIRWPELDIDMRIFNAVDDPPALPFYHFALKIDKLAAPTYHSNVRGEPAVDPSKIASFKTAHQVEASLSVEFEIGMRHNLPVPPQSLTALLSGISGWCLRYFAIVPKYKIRSGRLRSKKFGSADIMLWEKDDKQRSGGRHGAQIAFRGHHDAEKLWTSGTIDQSTKLSTSSNDTDATITVSNKLRGYLIDVLKMTAVESDTSDRERHRSRTHFDHHDDHSEFVLTFEDSRYRLEFVRLVEGFKSSAASSMSLVHRTSSSGTHDQGMRRINSLASGEYHLSPPIRSDTAIYRGPSS